MRPLSKNKPAAARAALFTAVCGLALLSAFFFHGQNSRSHIGGPMSLPKIFWLDYALTAWVLVPLYFWRSSLVSAPLRTVYGRHLAGFAVRGVAEMWLLYVTHSWIPPYGIAHNLFTMAMVTWSLARTPRADRLPEDAAARAHLTSIRVALVFEISFAWLFFEAVQRQTSRTWFASDDPAFAFINGLTWTAVTLGILDLGRIAWLASGSRRRPAAEAVGA